jgi:hypothetical protein
VSDVAIGWVVIPDHGGMMPRSMERGVDRSAGVGGWPAERNRRRVDAYATSAAAAERYLRGCSIPPADLELLRFAARETLAKRDEQPIQRRQRARLVKALQIVIGGLSSLHGAAASTRVDCSRLEMELKVLEVGLAPTGARGARVERRLRFAIDVLHTCRVLGLPPLTPTRLLAGAVAWGCESPKPRESQQAALLEAWKKRHARATKLERAAFERTSRVPLDVRLAVEARMLRDRAAANHNARRARVRAAAMHHLERLAREGLAASSGDAHDGGNEADDS